MSRLPLFLLLACTGKDEPVDSTPPVEDATGLAGAVGAIETSRLLGTYWEEGATGSTTVWWGLVEPTDWHYADYFGGNPDSCTTHLGFPRVTVYDLGVANATLMNGSNALLTTPGEDGFFALEAAEGEIPTGLSFDLAPLDGGELDGMAVAGLVETATPLTLESPALGGESLIPLGAEDLTLRWSAPDADAVYVIVRRMDAADPTRLVEQLGCAVVNDGEFTVPADAWDGVFESGEWLYVYVGAVAESLAILPLNGSDSRLVGIDWSVGAAKVP